MSPESEISQATRDVPQEKYSRRSTQEDVNQGYTVSPDPSPPQDFKRKTEEAIIHKETRSFPQLREYIKDRLAEIEPRGFLAIERSFVLADEGKTRELSMQQFSEALLENGIDTTQAERKILYETSSGDGKNLPYLKWINDMRGQMAPERENLCSELFQLLDTRGTKNINVESFERRFNPDSYNDCKNGKRTGEEVFDEFADRLDLFGRLGGYDFKSGNITYDEYMEFWDNVSSIIRNPKDFENLLKDCFIK